MKIVIIEDEYLGGASGQTHNKADAYVRDLLTRKHIVYLFDGGTIWRFDGGGSDGKGGVVVKRWDGKSASVDAFVEWAKYEFRKESRIGMIIDFKVREIDDYGVVAWNRLRIDQDMACDLYGVVLSKSVGTSSRDQISQAIGIPADRIFSRMTTSPGKVGAVFPAE